MSWSEKLERARVLGWSEVTKRIAGRIRRPTVAFLRRQRDQWSCTYASFPRAHRDRLRSRLVGSSSTTYDIDPTRTAALAQRSIEHRFDLLGSGLVEVKHGVACRGLEGHRYDMSRRAEHDPRGEWLRGRINGPNLHAAQHRWRLIEGDYAPIDWQLDFKSGYRWSERVWYEEIVFGQLPGVDVKVPWELSRMQHLPQLAWAFALARQAHPGFEPPERYAREMRNQLLDFVATNPPRFGVNWTCTMDVGIRVANWLVAVDLARAAGASFDAAFESVLLDSVYDHARHIVENLEWFPEGRSNHYLANVVGLLFAASYLPDCDEVRAWRQFARTELVHEVGLQFGADGGNFEASTSYHRLSAEMVLYATALALGDRADGESAIEFPAWYQERLERMAELTAHCTKPDGTVVQIGDNDSGRFVKLDPAMHLVPSDPAAESGEGMVSWKDDHLAHGHLVTGIRALYPERDGERATPASTAIEARVIRRLSRGATFRSYRAPDEPPASAAVRVGTSDDWIRRSRDVEDVPAEKRRRYVFAVDGGGARSGLELHGYPQFGIWIYRSARIFMSIRCGGVGERVNASHAHNDQLAVELSIRGHHEIRDPGSYLYTPLPTRRNEYRSICAHFAPRLIDRGEPSGLDTGLFRMTNIVVGEVQYFGSEGFVGQHNAYGVAVQRLVELTDDSVIVIDHSTEPLANAIGGPPFSPGYGLRER